MPFLDAVSVRRIVCLPVSPFKTTSLFAISVGDGLKTDGDRRNSMKRMKTNWHPELKFSKSIIIFAVFHSSTKGQGKDYALSETKGRLRKIALVNNVRK